MTETRELFRERLRYTLSPRELDMIDLAYKLTKGEFRTKRRRELDASGKPVRYFEHPRRAALILIDEVRCIDALLIQIILLHDICEDTRDITRRFVQTVFGKEVARSVGLLTKRGYAPRDRRKDARLERRYTGNLWRCGDWRTLFAKGCDRLDNLRTLPPDDPAFQRKQLEETRRSYFPIFERMVELAPAAYRDGARWLRDEIRRVVVSREIALRLAAEQNTAS